MSTAVRIALGLSFLMGTYSASVLSAPCCGGGGGTTTLITGDARAQLATHYLFSYVVGDVQADGTAVWRSPDSFESQHGFFIEGAYVFLDRWQVMARLPILYNRNEIPGSVSATTGFGDFSMGGGFEALPEWSYSPWKPKIHIFTQLQIPLGNSIYESSAASSTDAFSKGFWTFGFGAVVTKAWNDWDAVFTLEGHQGLPRRFDVESLNGNFQIQPGFGLAVALAPGYSFSTIGLRVGLSLTFLYDGPTHIAGGGVPDSSSQIVWNPSLQANYALPQGFSVAGVYTDQTLLGPARSVALRRYFGVSLTRSWDR